jgi:hypothetical protein
MFLKKWLILNLKILFLNKLFPNNLFLNKMFLKWINNYVNLVINAHFIKITLAKINIDFANEHITKLTIIYTNIDLVKYKFMIT